MIDLTRLSPPATPALVLIEGALERNLAIMQGLCDRAGVALRAHGKMHKCSTLALRQVALGAKGVCAQTVGEAEVFARCGVADVLVTSPAPLSAAPRIAALGKITRIGAVADSGELIAALGSAARGAGIVIDLLVDIDLGQHRTGVRPEDALALVRLAASTEGLSFQGLQGYLGHLQHIEDAAARLAANAIATTRLVALKAAIEAAGLGVATLTGGGTGTHSADLAGGVFTELQAGSYAVMDVEYDACAAPGGGDWPFEPALFIAASVVSTVHRTHVVVDAGLKAMSVDGPFARVAAGAAEGSLWRPMGDEHGAIFHPAALGALRAAGRDPLAFERAIDEADASLDPPGDAPRLGDVVWLQPGHCDPTVNLYDAFHVARQDGTWERWPIDARRTSFPL